MDSLNDDFKSTNFDGFKGQEMKKSPDSIDIFESIKNDEFEEEEYRKETHRRLIIIAISSLILLLIIIGATIGILVPMHTNKNSSSSTSLDERSSIEAICNTTLYRDACFSSIYSLKMSSSNNQSQNPDSPDEIFRLSLQVALNELTRLKSSMPKRKLIYLTKNDTITHNALNICDDLIQDAIDHVNMSMASALDIDEASKYVVSDIRTWLSSAITDQETCLDGLMEFESISKSLQEEMRVAMRNSTMYTSNSLAIISNIFKYFQDFKIPIHRKLSGWEAGRAMHRRMVEAEEEMLVPNVTVAKDGSGDYESIMEAVKSMPKRSEDMFVIYVKEGEYKENVFVDSDSWNLMVYGDGMNKTIVSGSLNKADGVSTFNSGTFIVEGRGFVAKDMGFRNTAGPSKFQAVAFRSSSDKSVFHRCFFDGYQDTLYAHRNRQFYRDCIITGTVDFIFGNAAAIFQNCTILPRQPGPKQYNTITAQRKSDPNQNMGFSIQRSVISLLDNLTAQAFLGRPWRNYSTTVISRTYIAGIVDPAGWIQWEPNSEAINTLFYAEYKNNGPGSITSQRVSWAGYKPIITQDEAEKFSVEPFIQGSQWLMKANVEYDSQI